MAEARPGVEALLAVARAEFAQRLPTKMAEVEKLLSDRAWDEARRASHKLRGSAATRSPTAGICRSWPQAESSASIRCW